MARSGIQLCYPFEQKRLAKWRPPYLLQPKLDGERCRAVWTGAEYILLSSEQNIILSCPHINLTLNEQRQKMLEAGRTPFNELDGELYRHGWSFEDVHSVVGRTKNLHPHYHMIQLHIFDLVTTETQLLRTASLHAERAWLDTEATKLVQSQICYNFDEIMKAYRALIDEGYEGIILRQLEATYVRRRSTAVMKFKPKKEDDYEIVAFQEAVSANGTPKNMLGAVMCRGNDLTVFKSGAGQLTHEERRRYWAERAEWIGKTVHVGYQNLTEKGGVPRFGIVIELLPKLFTDPQAFFNPLLH